MSRTRRQNEGPPSHLWEMVGQHPHQVGLEEVEEVAAHESAGEQVAAGEPLYFGLIERLAGGLLGAHDESGAAESGDLGSWRCRGPVIRNPSGALTAYPPLSASPRMPWSTSVSTPLPLAPCRAGMA